MVVRRLLSLGLLAALMAGTAAVPPAGAQSAGQTGTGQTGAAPAQGDTPATLVADNVELKGDNSIVATGHVVVFYQGTRMEATKVVYDKANDKIDITGPIRLTQPDGTIVLADQAELATDLKNGILTSARMVLASKLQLAAAQINRVDGRYTQLTKTVASSCQVCAGHRTPLWEIRATKVIHDAEKHQLYFDNATFRLAGVPILYLPRLRLPDASVKRSTGFLLPMVHNSTLLGTGVTLPYFVALGPSKDLTLYPELYTRSRTLAFRYRQAFRNGYMSWTGAASRDDFHTTGTRAYLFGSGDFNLRNDYKLHFDVQLASDKGYISDHDFSGLDRLQSDLILSRTRRSDFSSARLYAFHSLRGEDDNATLPEYAAGYTRIHRFTMPGIGGQASLSFDTLALTRPSSTDVSGRDDARASAEFNWQRSWIFGPGVVFTSLAKATTDFYVIRQDSTYPSTITRTIPEGAVELRWPLVKQEAGGGSQVLEPIVQLILSPDSVTAVPDEDSTMVSFDEGNLWSLNRYAGYDAIEYGPRANVGLRWTRYSPGGWVLGAVAGRVFRVKSAQDFSTASGLDGARSDWLTGVRVSSPNGLVFTGRAVFNDQMSLSRSEAQLSYGRPRYNFSTSYTYLNADPSENRSVDTSEWGMGAWYKVSDTLDSSINWRYDFQAQRATSAGIGLNWHTECISVNLSLSRSFASSTSVTATTTFGLLVNLLGISGRSAGAAPSRCRS
ncbi:LPS-assembly protein LptD [Acidimangrovimonas sediminis]|uniref:LPS-assembly protein LptD n=1 Tax=Acidimangrovimonas sediminis TaxID=2056283 RepID=UPI000C7F90F0|nr:LPS assembly protein LptD [Acidimangrovimonas sediminis]